MDSRARCTPGTTAALLVVVLLGGLLAWPTGSSAVTVTVGRQQLLTFPDNNFGCTISSASVCRQTVSPTALTTPGDRAVVPSDGVITSWRVVGKAGGNFLYPPIFLLSVVRPSGAQYAFVASTEPGSAPLDNTNIPVSPVLPVAAGDLLGLQIIVSGDPGAFAQVSAVTAPGAGYNLFSSPIGDGDILSPTSTGQHVEPFFNANVVLERPFVSSLSAGAGSTAGGQTVTIDGDHLAGVSQVTFGNVAAPSFSAVSNSKVRAVTPPSAPGTVDVSVTTVGGTSAASGADRFTFVAPGTSPAVASFAGSRSTITVSRKRKFRFSFHATPGLTGSAVFRSLRKVRVSRTMKVTLGKKAFTVPASGKVTLRVKLSRKKFRILKLNRRIRTRLTVTLENTAGLTSTASKKITLKAPQRR